MESKLRSGKKYKPNTIVFYDLETTGFNPYHDKIIEYCFIEDNDENTITENRINSLVNPEQKFEYFISKLTGIYPDELEKHFPITIHMPLIIDYLERCSKGTINYLVAHNNDGFDKLYLNNNIKKYGISHYSKIGRRDSYKKYKYIDTLLLAKKMEKTKTLKKFSLKELTAYYNIDAGNHRAMQDTIALKELYYSLVNDLSHELNIDFEILKQDPEIVYNYIYN